MEFSPEMTHHLLGWRESGQGDLQVQVTPMWGTVVALESRCVIQAKNVEETNMETEALVPLLSDCPEHFRFSSSCDIDIPSQFLSSLEPSCNSCVLFWVFFFFLVFFCILWFEENVPVFALASLPLACCYLGEFTNQFEGLLFLSTIVECQNVFRQFL